MPSDKKHYDMRAKGPATSKGPVFLEHAKRIGYDGNKLCQVCESGFHPTEECPKTLPGLYSPGKDWGKIIQDLNEDLEPAKHATHEDRQLEHHLAWDEEDRQHFESQDKKRKALIRRQSQEQVRREKEIDRAINSRIGSVKSSVSSGEVPADLLVDIPEKKVRRVRFATTPPDQQNEKGLDES